LRIGGTRPLVASDSAEMKQGPCIDVAHTQCVGRTVSQNAKTLKSIGEL